MIEHLAYEHKLAFLMADHPRLGSAACGEWRIHSDPRFSFQDILRMILDAATIHTSVVRTISPGECFLVGEGQLRGQCYATVDSCGDVIVLDRRSHKVKIFRGTDGELMREFGGEGVDVGKLNTPRGIAVDVEGNIVIADCDNHRVQVFDASGALLRTFGRYGSGDGELKFPNGVGIDAEGNIIVADCDNDRLVVFDKVGDFVGTLGERGSKAGQFCHPVGVTVSSDGRIIVADGDNNRVQVLRRVRNSLVALSNRMTNRSCALPFVVLASMGSKGSGDGELRYPCSAAGLPGGGVAVSDSLNHRLVVFDADGGFVRSFGSKGSGMGELKCPYSVVVDGAGNLVVADGGNSRVQVFGRGWAGVTL
mmetsp:Transcript_23048/g.46621  ORF Transcript_23048/g.46621 Transcript_23048/m.46621 type:complete len:365 (-) Transcript_23048:36-1130(-)